MLGEENKALICLFDEELWNKGNLAAADELMAADATIVLPGMGQVSREDFKAFAANFRSAFPDGHATADDLIAEGDRVATRWTWRGTHQGAFQGIAPTGREVMVSGSVFYLLASGKITQFWGFFDGLALMQQLGVILPTSQAIPSSG